MFRFKQFTIHQERTPMKVGTDGVLLGAWAQLEKAVSILDIGTGTGLIALMAAQRNTFAFIDALEREPNACTEARENILSSPWADRIEVIPCSLQTYVTDKKYDHIVCNPPFFVRSTPPPDNGRTVARHTGFLSHPELLAHAARLLAPEGNFCVILPPNEARQSIETAAAYYLFPHRITHVLPNPGKPDKRWLIEFRHENSIPREDRLIVELSRHRYSEEYIALTRDFYLYL